MKVKFSTIFNQNPENHRRQKSFRRNTISGGKMNKSNYPFLSSVLLLPPQPQNGSRNSSSYNDGSRSPNVNYNSSQTPSQQDPSIGFMDLTNFFKVYFDFAYFTCISPFRLKIKWDEAGSERIIQLGSWWPQRVVCALGSCFSLASLVKLIRIQFPINPNAPAQYFAVMFSLTIAVLFSLIWKKFWLDKELFLRIMKFLDGKDFKGNFCTLPLHPGRKSAMVRFLHRNCWKKWANLIYNTVTFVLALLFMWTYERNSCHPRKTLTFTLDYLHWYWEGMQDIACEKFFLEVNGTCPEEGWRRTAAQVLAFPAKLGFYHFIMLVSYAYSLLLITSAVLWCSTMSFLSQLSVIGRPERANNDDSDHDLKMLKLEPLFPRKGAGQGIFERIMYLQKLSILLTKLIGNLVTCHIFLVVVTCAMFFSDFFANKGRSVRSEPDFSPAHTTQAICYFAKDLLILMVAAHLCQKMQSQMEAWMTGKGNRSLLAEDEREIIFRILDNKLIAISASNSFPITYSLLVHVSLEQ